MSWSFQLYSARETALEESLKIISDAGYLAVEAYRDNFSDPVAFRSALEKYQLKLSSMHINIQPMRDDFDACVQLAHDFDCRHIVCPYLEPAQRPQDAQGWQSLAEELATFAKRWRESDCDFAWHNHDFEFIACSDGTIPMQVLLEFAPDMKWEVDVAWIVRADAAPEPWIVDHRNRISAVHLKDIAPAGECANEDGWADLGSGTVPWPSLVEPLLQTPASMYIMEHDNPSDLSRFARRSIDFANRELSRLSAKG